MPVVYKYPLLSRVVDVEMPEGGTVRLVDRDPASGDLAIWVEHDLNRKRCMRRFLVVGTGSPISPLCAHIGSVIAGAFVWHVYESQ